VATLKVPKPASVTESPFFIAKEIAPIMASMAWPVSFLVKPVLAATALTRSVLFIVLTSSAAASAHITLAKTCKIMILQLECKIH